MYSLNNPYKYSFYVYIFNVISFQSLGKVNVFLTVTLTTDNVNKTIVIDLTGNIQRPLTPFGRSTNSGPRTFGRNNVVGRNGL